MKRVPFFILLAVLFTAAPFWACPARAQGKLPDDLLLPADGRRMQGMFRLSDEKGGTWGIHLQCGFIQESTGNMALSITSAFSGLGQGLQQLGGQWSSWGSLVSSTAGTVAQGIGRIQAAQRQYGQDSERTSQETQAAYIDMGIGVGDAMASMGARYKAVAIAGAVISALLAAVRALASTGPPMNYVLAALSLAAGMATVARIRSSPACERGTPGLDYADFGRQTPAYLHHEEAVIPRGHGGPNILAGEIAAAMPGGGESGLLAEVRALRNDFARLPYTMNRAFRDGALLGTA